MKIGKDNTIRITGRSSTSNVFTNLKKGRSVTARVLERIGNKEAILEIGGNRLRAEFLNGIPPGDKIPLIFEKRDYSTFIFRTAKRDNGFSELNKIFDFSIFKLDDIGRNGLLKIKRYIRDEIIGIFALNSHMLRVICGKRYRGNSFTEFLNKLLKLGIQKEDLIFLSYIFLNNRGINIDVLISLMFFKGLEAGKLFQRFKRYDNHNNILKADIGALSEKLEGLLIDDENGIELFRELIYHLSINEDQGSGDFSKFEIPYFDSDDFRCIEYICTNEGLALSLEFSSLGRLDILLKTFDSDMKISIFCENEEVLIELKRDIDELSARLEDILKKNVKFDIYISRDVIKKIIEINSSMIMNSIFDMRV